MAFGKGLTDKKESWKHYYCKTVAYKILVERGYKATMEAERGGGFIDVLDITNGVGYEFETNYHPETALKKKELYCRNAFVKDVVVIFLREVPDDYGRIADYLRKRLA